MSGVPEGCTWMGDPAERSLLHIAECPKCEELWPMLAKSVQEDPEWLSGSQ
jgi:hypothetical protein